MVLSRNILPSGLAGRRFHMGNKRVLAQVGLPEIWINTLLNWPQESSLIALQCPHRSFCFVRPRKLRAGISGFPRPHGLRSLNLCTCFQSLQFGSLCRFLFTIVGLIKLQACAFLGGPVCVQGSLPSSKSRASYSPPRRIISEGKSPRRISRNRRY
jgi:hypothetical protein